MPNIPERYGKDFITNNLNIMNKEHLRYRIEYCKEKKSICVKKENRIFTRRFKRKMWKDLAEFWQLNIDDLERLL